MVSHAGRFDVVNGFVANRRLALFLNDAANDYQRMQRQDCEAAALRRNFSLSVFNAGNDHERQAQQVRSVLDQPEALRPCALLISPVREISLADTIYAAGRLGVAWVLLSRWLDAINDARRRNPLVPVFSVTPDQVEAGRIQGRQILTVLGRETQSELLHIRGPLGTSTMPKRAQGLHEVLQPFPKLRRTTFNGDWSEESGRRVTRDWLQLFGRGPLPPFVLSAQSDTMAMGARQALLEHLGPQGPRAVQSIPIFGCNGTPEYGQRLVSTGILVATVVIPSVAGRAVEAIAEFLAGNGLPAPEITIPVYSFPEVNILNERRANKPFSRL